MGALAALCVAALVGLVNGLISVKVRIPSFLVTLGMLSIINGITRNWNNLQSLPIRNERFSEIFGKGGLGPISSLLIWTVVVGLIGHIALHHLRLGAPCFIYGGRPQRCHRCGYKHSPV